MINIMARMNIRERARSRYASPAATTPGSRLKSISRGRRRGSTTADMARHTRVPSTRARRVPVCTRSSLPAPMFCPT